jgi:uncharacterized sporulation protein YeaH/YhbH (DUF444 family)
MLTSFQRDFSEFFEHKQIFFIRKVEQIRNVQSHDFFTINGTIVSYIDGDSNLFVIL